MCGIVAAVARRNVVPILLEGLQRLEYRGYDSAGVAVVSGMLKRLRSTGRVAELARLAHEHGLSGNLGIAHTRWATHGVPSEKNAHPHVSRGVSVVHNGIIKNNDELRGTLLLGLHDGESFAASDASALLPMTRRMITLEEGDCAEVSLAGARIVDAKGNAVERTLHLSELSPQAVELGQYRHDMQKEIFEQPEAITNTLEMVLNAQAVSARLFGTEAERIFEEIDAALIVACGTSYHAGLVARYWLERSEEHTSE